MSDPWGYRNHIRFTVRRDGEIGFMEHGTHRFLRIDHCEIALPAANDVLRRAQGRTMQTKALSVRVGEHTNEVLVQPRLKWRPMRSGGVRSGQAHYHEVLRGARYRVSSPAFFQVNSRQAERLIELVVARARAVEPRVVVDAYAGVGTFAVALAQIVPEVLTIEWSAAAGDDAEVNLAPYDNVRRIIGTVEEALPGLRADVVVVDPPRQGLDRSVVDTLIETAPKRIVYVSCDPATLARDLRLFVDGGYSLTEVQPIDMFPHTQHIECITTLDRA
jgi:23S rRNA (uracil1939-C5)-methyltransferase